MLNSYTPLCNASEVESRNDYWPPMLASSSFADFSLVGCAANGLAPPAIRFLDEVFAKRDLGFALAASQHVPFPL